MKISDFTMQQYNVADPGQPPKMGIWKGGSKGAKIGIGVCGGKKYQVKIHEYEPKWYNASQKIAAKEAEIRACPADDPDKLAALQSELATLRANKSKDDAADALSDAYVEYKKRLARALNNPADSTIVGPVDFWKEPLEWKNNEVYSAEAVPWVENVAVGFSSGSPIVFARDLDERQQFSIIASLADALAKLHERGIIHGDLKLGNTLITKQGGEFKVVLIDFDAAILMSELTRMKDAGPWYHIVGGTYFAPEVLDFFNIAQANSQDDFDACDKSVVTEKWDIFSLAITIYEYFYGETSAENLVPMRSPDGELLDVAMFGEAVSFGYKPDFPDTMGDLLYGMLNWMLEKEPSDRPTAVQVRDVFKSGDLSGIPSKYLRNPLWEEHQADYELIPKDGVTIQKGTRPNYIVRRGFRVTRSIDELVKEGLAKCNKAPEPAVILDELWPSDGDGKLPKCVTRGSSEGQYVAYIAGMRKNATFASLKSDGIICSAAEGATPWPCDSEIHFTSAKKITRNLNRNYGPGYYLVGEGIAAIRYTKQQLIEGGYASKGVHFTLDRADAELYVTVPDAIPDNVISIVRTMSLHIYLVRYAGGRTEKLSIDALLSRGYVKKK